MEQSVRINLLILLPMILIAAAAPTPAVADGQCLFDRVSAADRMLIGKMSLTTGFDDAGVKQAGTIVAAATPGCEGGTPWDRPRTIAATEFAISRMTIEEAGPLLKSGGIDAVAVKQWFAGQSDVVQKTILTPELGDRETDVAYNSLVSALMAKGMSADAIGKSVRAISTLLSAFRTETRIAAGLST